MEILQLQHFLAVVDEGTFTRAAERVFRTQPAVSQNIKKLEDEVGASLFVRGPSGDVSLTEAGKLLVDYARRMIGLRDQAARHLCDLIDLKIGSLEIAAYESAAVYLLPAPLRRYLQLHRGIKVRLYCGSLDDIPRQVLNRNVQIGFVKEKPISHELECVEAYSDEMTVIASPRNKLAARKDVSIRDLDEYPIVLHHQSKATQRMVLRAFEKHQIRCNVVAELCNFEIIKHFVRADFGIAIVPHVTVANDIEEKALVVLPFEELNEKRTTFMIFRSNYLPDSAKELVRIIREFNERQLPRNSFQTKTYQPSFA